MKGHFIFTLVITFIIGFTGRNGVAQNFSQLINPFKIPSNITTGESANLRTSASGKPPLISHNYYPDSSIIGWKLYTISDFKYDSLDRIVSVITRNAASNQLLGKEIYVYDIYGYNILHESHGFNQSTNSWEVYSGTKYTLTYNPSGKITSKVYENYDSVSKSKYKDKTIYTYDAANRLSETYGKGWRNNNWETTGYKKTYSYNPDSTIAGTVWHFWVNNQWRLSSRETYSYNTGTKKLSEIVEEELNISTGVWYMRKRDRYLSWQNDKLTHAQTQWWTKNGWENQSNILITFDSLGGNNTLFQNWQNNGWVDDTRSAIFFDNKHNDTGSKFEMWENNNWKVIDEIRKANTYDSQDNILETIRSRWDTKLNVMKKEWRNVFYFKQPGSHPNILFNVFPNPTSDFIKIELLNQSTAKLQLTNLTGRIVKTETLLAANSQIDISALPNGIYLLNIQTVKGTQTSKIVKQ